MKLITHAFPSIFQQLQLEEALLRGSQEDYLILSQGSSPSVVMGISGKVEDLVFQKRLREQGIDLIRRYSGGGTVVVDENTVFVSFILNKSSVELPPFPRAIMEWTAKIYAKVFGESFSLRENDYVLGSLKCGGNAQSITKDRFVHHTSFLWDWDKQRMDVLKMPQKTPDYRQGRSHQEFLTPLKDHFLSKKAFMMRVKEAVAEEFSLVEETDYMDVLLCPHRRCTELVEENSTGTCSV